MKIFKILRFGLMKYTHRGVRLSIALTFRCNLKCPYCVVDKPQGKTPIVHESTLNELMYFIKRKFPYKIREIKLTGGSPELHPNFVEFTNWLLDQGYFVMIFTNLIRPDILLKLKQTYRLMFIASYHHSEKYNYVSIPIEKYVENYNIIKDKYRIIVEEIGDKPSDKWLSFSRLKREIYESDMIKNNVMIRVSPDLKIYCNCYDVYDN